MIKRRSAMSKGMSCDVKFQLKAIECEATTSSNFFLFSHGNSELIVIYSHLKFLLQQGGVQAALYGAL